jgi:hypothetical protein
MYKHFPVFHVVDALDMNRFRFGEEGRRSVSERTFWNGENIYLRVRLSLSFPASFYALPCFSALHLSL